MSKTSLAIILLATLTLTLIVLAISGISFLQKAKAVPVNGQNGNDGYIYVENGINHECTFAGLMVAREVSATNQIIMSLTMAMVEMVVPVSNISVDP